MVIDTNQVRHEGMMHPITPQKRDRFLKMTRNSVLCNLLHLYLVSTFVKKGTRDVINFNDLFLLKQITPITHY